MLSGTKSAFVLVKVGISEQESDWFDSGISKLKYIAGRSSLVVKVTDSWPSVMNSSLIPLKNHSALRRCTLNLSRLKRPPGGVEVRRGGYQLRCHSHHLTMVQNYKVHRQKPFSS
ncbi:hypothetical protein TNCV_3199411 [Trichonephila clavipes]|nr:hypothetical protein TNCV_3199411 [Trichonephila clavipes]